MEQSLREYLSNIYLDYLNNYLTIDKWAEHNGLSVKEARDLMMVAKSVFTSNHPDN